MFIKLGQRVINTDHIVSVFLSQFSGFRDLKHRQILSHNIVLTSCGESYEDLAGRNDVIQVFEDRTPELYQAVLKFFTSPANVTDLLVIDQESPELNISGNWQDEDP